MKKNFFIQEQQLRLMLARAYDEGWAGTKELRDHAVDRIIKDNVEVLEVEDTNFDGNLGTMVIDSHSADLPQSLYSL